MLIVKHKWDDISVNWLEEDMQAACVTALHRIEKSFENNGHSEFTFAGDQNGGKRGRIAAAKSKILGIRSGEPDLRIYCTEGRLYTVELKRLRKGRVSADQLERHRLLNRLGHTVEMVFAVTPQDAVDQLIVLLSKWLNCEPIELKAIAFDVRGSK